MSFKPANAGKPTGNGGAASDFVAVYPKPGSRPARISLIVDLGIQEREDYQDPATKQMKPQKPCHQIYVFADLVNDVVDYGGNIGKAPYRLPLTSTFMGEIKPINFQATPPKDANGKIIEGKPWGLHPLSPITKVAKAGGREDIVTSMEIDQLLNLPFMAAVEIKETPAKGDKKDKDGNPLVYKNVNYKGPSPVTMIPVMDENGEQKVDDEGNPLEKPMVIKALPQPARCITFDNATKEDIVILRKSVIQKIKLATNYAGSAMEAAIQAYEAENGVVEAAAAKPAEKPAQTASNKPKAPVAPEDDDQDVPF